MWSSYMESWTKHTCASMSVCDIIILVVINITVAFYTFQVLFLFIWCAIYLQTILQRHLPFAINLSVPPNKKKTHKHTTKSCVTWFACVHESLSTLFFSISLSLSTGQYSLYLISIDFVNVFYLWKWHEKCFQNKESSTAIDARI